MDPAMGGRAPGGDVELEQVAGGEGVVEAAVVQPRREEVELPGGQPGEAHAVRADDGGVPAMPWPLPPPSTGGQPYPTVKLEVDNLSN